MKEQIIERLEALRSRMKAESVDACYIPTSDYHSSEYVGDYFQERAYFSGFTGSAGTLVVQADSAHLWTDGRYFLQAADQLHGTGVTLMKMGEPGVPTIPEFLASSMKADEVLALDGRTVGEAEYKKLEEALTDVLFRIDFDPAEYVWLNRPALSRNPVYGLAKEYTGRTAQEKLADLADDMKKKGADVHVITALDDIAWLFNLRGSDVEFNPVFLSYAVIELTEDANPKATLFTDASRLEQSAKDLLLEASVSVKPYDAVYDYVKKFNGNNTVLLSETQASHRFFDILSGTANVVTCRHNPASVRKQIRNAVEEVNVSIAHRKDAVAMCRLLYLLDKEYKSGRVKPEERTLKTELDVSRTLGRFRMEEPGCVGPSFETIAGYGPHGAIIHYEPTPETDAPLDAKSFLLIDSGGQYYEGTTDITRTVALGPLTDEERTDFTLVLKGTIDLAMAYFPVGTKGEALDILARKALWDSGQNYNHGTGHGVGHMLCVHEGPLGIHRTPDPDPLKPGLVLSDEPGVYKEGKYGVRIENLVKVVKDGNKKDGGFLMFETLTSVPIDRDAIKPELLTDDELIWLNGYHAWVHRNIGPMLGAAEENWLAEVTKGIERE